MNKNPEANQNKKWIIIALILGTIIILGIVGIVAYNSRERERERESKIGEIGTIYPAGSKEEGVKDAIELTFY